MSLLEIKDLVATYGSIKALLCGKKYYDIIAKRIAIVPEGRNVFPAMTVEENLALGVLFPSKGQ